MKSAATNVKKVSLPMLYKKEGRLLVWRKIRGMWKKKKPDPIQELKRMRREW